MPERSDELAAWASTDFLSRLAAAEQRDDESFKQQQQLASDSSQHLLAANALDDMLLDNLEAADHKASSASTVVYPTLEEVKLLISLVWTSPAAKRNHKHDSSTYVEGTFNVPSDVTALDLPTFESVMQLAQKPAEIHGQGRTHSAAQRAGWSALFRQIDADQTGVLTRPELARYVQRQQRVRTAALQEEEEDASRSFTSKAAGSKQARDAIERELQMGLEDQIVRTRSMEAATEALQSAIEREMASSELFGLITRLAPPCFQCVEARLFLCRDDGSGAQSRYGGGRRQELYTLPPASNLGLGSGQASEVVLPVDTFSIPGAAVSLKEEQNVEDVWRDARFDTENRGAGALRKEEFKSTLCMPIVGLADEKDGRTPCLGCLQLINRVPRGVAWDAARSTYTPIDFRSRDVKLARAFCAKLAEAIVVGHAAQARQDASQHAALEAQARRKEMREWRRERAKVAQQESFHRHSATSMKRTRQE